MLKTHNCPLIGRRYAIYYVFISRRRLRVYLPWAHALGSKSQQLYKYSSRLRVLLLVSVAHNLLHYLMALRKMLGLFVDKD